MIIQAWQRPDLSKERSSPRLHLRENRGPPPETIQGCSRIQGQWCLRLRLSARQGQPGRSRPLARRERSAAARAASGRRRGWKMKLTCEDPNACALNYSIWQRF